MVKKQAPKKIMKLAPKKAAIATGSSSAVRKPSNIFSLKPVAAPKPSELSFGECSKRVETPQVATGTQPEPYRLRSNPFLKAICTPNPVQSYEPSGTNLAAPVPQKGFGVWSQEQPRASAFTEISRRKL